MSAILAGLWAWMGVVYHLIYFTPVNPGARLFAVVFIAQAALQLGVYEDLGLLAAGLAGIWLAFDPPPRQRHA